MKLSYEILWIHISLNLEKMIRYTKIYSQASFISHWIFYEMILHWNKMLMQHHVAITDPNTVWHKNVVEWGYGGANIGYYFEKTRPHATSKMCHV